MNTKIIFYVIIAPILFSRCLSRAKKSDQALIRCPTNWSVSDQFLSDIWSVSNQCLIIMWSESDWSGKSGLFVKKIVGLRIFQPFRPVKFIEKFKSRVKNLKIEKIIAFDKNLHELFFDSYFHLSKNLFLTLKNNEVADLTHFPIKCGCF